MVRSGNRNVARDLACALGMQYAFVPCYLNLTKGSGIEQDLPGANDLGLHGNAVLSRYPMGNIGPCFWRMAWTSWLRAKSASAAGGGSGRYPFSQCHGDGGLGASGCAVHATPPLPATAGRARQHR
jgi:hypothetical protein